MTQSPFVSHKEMLLIEEELVGMSPLLEFIDGMPASFYKKKLVSILELLGRALITADDQQGTLSQIEELLR